MTKEDSTTGSVIEISTDSLKASIARNLTPEASSGETGSIVTETSSGSVIVDKLSPINRCVTSQDSLPSSIDLPRRDSNPGNSTVKDQAMDIDEVNSLTTVHETVSLISGHVKKNFPSTVPSTCLVDPEMVS